MSLQKSTVFYHLGNVLLVASFIGFFVIFAPLFSAYIAPPDIKQVTATTGMFITIPKIHAQAPVIEQVDPWNEQVYMAALKRGVAQAKGTALPGQKGTIFIFAHSSGAPWDVTRYNTIFLRLGELQAGDTITIVRNGKTFTYKVRDKKEVWPSEVNYLMQKDKTQLVLQTCTPIGTSLKRLLIFADPQ